RPKDSAHQGSCLALTSSDHLGMHFRRPQNDDPNQTGGLDLRQAFSQLRLKHRWQSGNLALDTVAMFETQDNAFDVGSENTHVRGRNFMLRSTGTATVSDDLAFSAGFDGAARRSSITALLPK